MAITLTLVAYTPGDADSVRIWPNGTRCGHCCRSMADEAAGEFTGRGPVCVACSHAATVSIARALNTGIAR